MKVNDGDLLQRKVTPQETKMSGRKLSRVQEMMLKFDKNINKEKSEMLVNTQAESNHRKGLFGTKLYRQQKEDNQVCKNHSSVNGLEGSTSILQVNKNKVEIDHVGDNVVTIVEKKKTTQQCAVQVEIGRRQQGRCPGRYHCGSRLPKQSKLP